MTLYDDLGVASNAAPSEIKKAYRRKAHRAHPDKGGSDAAFGALVKAYKVLADPQRRARYDRTGDAADEPDNSQAEVLGTISMHLDRVVVSALQGNNDPAQFDVVGMLKQSLEQGIAQLRESKAQAEKSKAVWVRLMDRFKHKKGQLSTLRILVKGKIADQENSAAEAERRIGVLKCVLDIVANETFEVEPRPDGFGYGFPPSGGRRMFPSDFRIEGMFGRG